MTSSWPPSHTLPQVSHTGHRLGLEHVELTPNSVKADTQTIVHSTLALLTGSAGSGHTTVPSGPNLLLGEMERSVESRDRRNPAAEGQLSVCVLPADQEEVSDSWISLSVL